MALNHTHARKEKYVVNIEHEKDMRNQIIVGASYQHYSGKKYKVVGIFRHSEDLILYVAYEGQYEDATLGVSWIRPLEMFLEQVEINGKMVQRFRISN